MPEETQRPRERLVGTLFMIALVASSLLGLAFQIARDPHVFLDARPGGLAELALWTAALAFVELLPVPVSPKLHLTLGVPIYLGLAIIYPPIVASTVVLVGTFDARELRGEISILKAAFNRCQVALSVLAASTVFHQLASVRSPNRVLIPTVLLAATTHYLVNVVSVSAALHLIYAIPMRSTLAQLRVGKVHEFLLNYVGLGFIGAVIAQLHDAVGLWSVLVFILPLIFARQMFFRTMALEEASKELKDREKVLKALSNRMAEERQDERMQIAAYLHDDLAQMLFRLTLQLEMAKKRLSQGDVPAVLKDLDGITSTKEQTSQAIRALIKDLHRSPIGRKGLGEAMQSFGEDMSRGSPTKILVDVVDVSLPPPIQLLIYQIAREAAMNALKHAEAQHIWISVHEIEDGVELQVRDDGKGFDTEAPPPEGHFGSVMMRERALVAGGRFAIQSELGRGTVIKATFPRVWVEEGSLLETNGHQPGDEAEPPSAEEPQVVRRGLARLVRFGRRSTQGTDDEATTSARSGGSNGSTSAPSPDTDRERRSVSA